MESFKKYLDEKLNKDHFHTSLEKGKFMKSKYGVGEYKNAMFLHDLDNKSGDGKSPMLATFAKQADAEKVAKQHGGKIIKSGMGTFRIIKEEVELEEGRKLRNVLTDNELKKSMKKALADKGNYKGGKVNWNFIDADVYMDLSAKGYDLRHPNIKYMERFDAMADKLDPDMKESVEIEENWATKAMAGKSPAKKKYQAPKDGEPDRAARMKKKMYGGMMGGLKKEEAELEEAKGKLVKNMRVKHIHSGNKGTVIKGGDKAGGRVEVEWDSGQTTVAAGKYLEPFKESVELDEVLDTPKAMDSYKNKAKASKEKAASSAAAKILRGKDKDGNRADHSPELKTMAKREKGMKMADKNAMKKTFKKLRSEAAELDEAKTGMFGGKYTSKDHMLGMKNFQKIRDKRAAQRNAEHQKQDPKMAKMGYAKHMLDTDKADAKARKRGIDPTGKYDKYKKKNGIREELNLSEDEINKLTAQYINENNITLEEIENMTEAELNELIGKAIGGAFKVGAKAAVGAARLAKKGAKAVSSQGRIEREKKKLAREKEKLAKAKASRSMFSKQGRENRAKDKAELQKLRDERKKLADKRRSGDFS